MIQLRLSRLRLGIVSIFMIAAIAVCGCGGSPGASESNDQPAPQFPKLIRQAGKPELMDLGQAGVPGMTYTTIGAVELPGTLETSGQITFDDRRVANIISRVAGRIEEVRVSQWDYVRRGQPIATLYSPDIMTAEAEYLQAKAIVPKLAGTGNDDFARSMLEASRRKLELLGIEPDQIAKIETAAPSFVMRAPISGNIVQNQALRGSAVSPGDIMYSLGTLEDVWITADIYEDDLSRVRVGQQLQAVTTAYPDEVFHGVIARISPNVDPNTHTLQIRCQVKNPQFKLKPQMLARVTIIVRPGTAVLVPLDALIFETNQYYAFVDVGRNLIERRTVVIGNWDQEGYARIISGLQIGDRVVTNQTIQVNALWHQSHGESS
ncbi:MAG TPA: efflux RND transporter periplasmic adaptor subunit [Candidatus Binataceae bacterium]|nr:efflux RND transporter periplasmic adaptor subunit [Candidatus Binataceae bacterium]